MTKTTQGTLLITSWIIVLVIGLGIGKQQNPRTIPPETKTTTFPSKNTLAGKQTFTPSDSQRKIVSSDLGNHQEMMENLAEILNISNRRERTRLILDFSDQIASADLEGIISGFREAGWIAYNRNEFAILLSTWIDKDPAAAITYLNQSNADGWTRKTATSAWASANPAAAAAAIKNLEDAGQINDWVIGLVEGIARNDPDAALHTLQGTPAGKTKDKAIHTIIPEVAIRGTAFASQWLEHIEEPKLQRNTATRLAQTLADRDPESAAQWIETITHPDTRKDASEIVSTTYAKHDLQAAKVWAENLPQDTMTEAAEGVVKELAKTNPAEAAQWLLELGDDPTLDGARTNFLKEASKEAPEIALENIPTLSRQNEQKKHYSQILRDWKKTDRKAAIQWARENRETLPPEIAATIIPEE